MPALAARAPLGARHLAGEDRLDDAPHRCVQAAGRVQFQHHQLRAVLGGTLDAAHQVIGAGRADRRRVAAAPQPQAGKHQPGRPLLHPGAARPYRAGRGGEQLEPADQLRGPQLRFPSLFPPDHRPRLRTFLCGRGDQRDSRLFPVPRGARRGRQLPGRNRGQAGVSRSGTAVEPDPRPGPGQRRQGHRVPRQPRRLALPRTGTAGYRGPLRTGGDPAIRSPAPDTPAPPDLAQLRRRQPSGAGGKRRRREGLPLAIAGPAQRRLDPALAARHREHPGRRRHRAPGRRRHLAGAGLPRLVPAPALAYRPPAAT
ncbi:hypothetical protein ALP65_04571 [Pseudomonas aeruginosa]|uniref:Uncharacterized protein n=1 Tax=Pseudomonas aeruginosa TaxID=287 RepID=A0A3M5E1F8_PSEAI|nr:hypothetical protein ALP65_04571 [Pseudomonas aeruginosa]